MCVYALFKFLSLLSHAKGRSRTAPAPSAWVLGHGRVDAAPHYGSACESTSQRGAVPRYVYKWRVTMQLALAAASSAVAHAMRNGIGMTHSELAFALALLFKCFKQLLISLSHKAGQSNRSDRLIDCKRSDQTDPITPGSPGARSRFPRRLPRKNIPMGYLCVGAAVGATGWAV